MRSEQTESRLQLIRMTMESLTSEYYSLSQVDLPQDFRARVRHDLVEACGLSQYLAVAVAAAIENGEIRHVRIELSDD